MDHFEAVDLAHAEFAQSSSSASASFETISGNW